MQVISVSEFVNSVKTHLEGEFRDMTIEGEVTNLSGSSAGHYYFTLSDRSAAISCALFKMDALRNPLIRKIKNGDQVIIRGPISVYAKRGTFQIIVKRLTPAGKGDLKAEFEKLKQKFIEKGYFEDQYKKEIPNNPRRIAIITAEKGAALQDFLNIMKRRSRFFDILIINAVVQGDACANSVISGIKKAEAIENLDVIVIARGGGSLEDLWGFNDERLVEYAFKCEIPIISAVGHQVDFSLLDFVSDFRCETPSSAAEILSEKQMDLYRNLRQTTKDLRSVALQFKSRIESQIYRLNPQNVISNLQSIVAGAKSRVEKFNPQDKTDLIGIYDSYQEIDSLQMRLIKSLEIKMHKAQVDFASQRDKLHTLNPTNVLKRGYTIITGPSGNVLTSKLEFDKIDENESMLLQFNDGKAVVKKNKD